jgi:hypothetical protein
LSLPTFNQAFADRDEASFHPEELITLASFNRRLTIDLPGVDPLTVGQRGHELLSRTALVGLIQEHLPALGLEHCPANQLPQGLNACLDSMDETRRSAAEAVAEAYGRRLGYLVASVLLSGQGLTSPLVGWEKAYLNHWRTQIQHIVLGGGHANGTLGQRVCSSASRALQVCDLQQPTLSAAGHPSFLPLLGAARSISPGNWQAAALGDFGGSFAKRALAWFGGDGALVSLQVLPVVPISHLTLEGKSAELAQAMTAILADTIHRAGPQVSLAPQVICSVAAYLQDGRPVQYAGRNMGIYSWLNALAEDLPDWFSQRISTASGRQVRFEFAHDGDAAAAALAGQAHTAVIMLGSALGVGFAPPGERFRPLSSDFKLIFPEGES